jgi:diaminopimelate epimerase
VRFVKVHGAGNDFVLLPDPEGRVELTPAMARSLCDRHLGVGGDGVIRLAPPRDGATADVFMDYRNADGSLAEMCGNGVRCVVKYLVDRQLVGRDGDPVVRVDTRAGVKAVEVADRHADGTVARVRVDMGAPVPGKLDLPLDLASGTVHLTTVSIGNPHAVLVVEDLATVPLADLAVELQHHPEFPDGVNVEAITVPSRDRVVGRIVERGVGETMASGSGASAMAAAAHLLGLTDRQVTVELPGGELDIDWTDDTLYVTGPAVEVCAGELDDTWLITIR